MGCNLCNAGQYGAKWSAELKLGTKKVSTAAVEFNMSIEDVLDHINHHEVPTENVNLEELLNDPNFFYRELLMLHVRLKDWMAFMMETEEFGVSNIDRGIKLIKEIRETLKLLAELQGKLNKGDTYNQQFIQIQTDLRSIRNAVLEVACPHCQPLIMQAMKDQKALPEGKNGSR
ncbi:MAG: hypothetical protein WC877_00275 [Dehalococcoidales bacterium]|jgi:hypothetical protein